MFDKIFFADAISISTERRANVKLYHVRLCCSLETAQLLHMFLPFLFICVLRNRRALPVLKLPQMEYDGGKDGEGGNRRGMRSEVRARTLTGKTVLAVLRKLHLGQVGPQLYAEEKDSPQIASMTLVALLVG